MKLFLENRQNKKEVTSELEEIIQKAIESTLDFEGINVETEVSMILIDNKEIHELNKQFREVDRPTDVLSFPQLEGEDFNKAIDDDTALDIDEEAVMLGDIALSLERAEEQAIDYGHSFEREVAYLTVHSMLHLLGYDHMEEEEKKVMREKEEKVMDIIGLSRGE